jgi:exosortase
MTRSRTDLPRNGWATSLWLVSLGVALAWAYWPSIALMADRWTYDPRYSHGYLVPVFAGVLLWLRRDRLERVRLRPSSWGAALIAAGIGVYLAGAYLYNDWLGAVSLLVVVAGICVLEGGWGLLRWSLPAVAFLMFMIPLPYRLELALGGPLQRMATEASTSVLQVLGVPAVAEGNIIRLGMTRVGVVEACSGLSMLLLFFAISTGVAILVQRPMLDKLVLVASAVPIALAANIARIVTTGVLNEYVGEKIGRFVYHDLAGWLMMPLALLLAGLEIWILERLFPEAKPKLQPSAVVVRETVGSR